MNDIQCARMLRIVVIKSFWRDGDLTTEEAKELLSGPLTPGDDSTVVDDSSLLELTAEEIKGAIEKS